MIHRCILLLSAAIIPCVAGPDSIVTFNEILAADPSSAKALKSLDRLYQTEQQWHELADVLTKQLELLSVGELLSEDPLDSGDTHAEQVDLLNRLGALRETELAEVAAAVDTYQRVLSIAPDDRTARAALERLLVLPDYELQVAQILDPIYKAQPDEHEYWMIILNDAIRDLKSPDKVPVV